MVETDHVTFTQPGLVLPRARFLTADENAKYEARVDEKYSSKNARDRLKISSNLFKVIELENQGIQVASLPELSWISEQNRKFLSEFYADAPAVVLNGAGDSYRPNNFLAKDLAKQIRKRTFKNPVIVTGLSLEESRDSEYGLKFKTTDKTEITEASDFRYENNGKRINHINSDYTIDFDNGGKFTFYAKNRGLSRFSVLRGGSLDSDWGNLANSGSYGRVVVVDAEGVTKKNLDALKSQTDELLKRQKKEREDLIARLKQ